jgi:hypothetical protein
MAAMDPSPIALFYLMLKVHKSPWSTRPVVSCAGSFVEIFSKWLDVQLKKLLLLSQTYLQDSNQVLHELHALEPFLPPDAKLFTSPQRYPWLSISSFSLLYLNSS